MPFIKAENLLCQVRLERRHLLGSKYTYKATMTTPVFPHLVAHMVLNVFKLKD